MKYNQTKPHSQPASHYRILTVLSDLIKHSGKKYCWPSQEYILKVLKDRHGHELKRRQLNYILRFLEDSGQIQRVRRIKGDPEKGMIFKSTLYWIKKKGWSLLNRLRRLLGGIFESVKDSRGDDPDEKHQLARAAASKIKPLGEVLSKTIPEPAF